MPIRRWPRTCSRPAGSAARRSRSASAGCFCTTAAPSSCWAGRRGEQATRSTSRLWFEGPLLPLPESQHAEDYPRDMAAEVRIAADAPLGTRRGRLWTAEGAAGGLALRGRRSARDRRGRNRWRSGPGRGPSARDDQWPDLSARGRGRCGRSPRARGQTSRPRCAAANIGSPLDSRLEVSIPTAARSRKMMMRTMSIHAFVSPPWKRANIGCASRTRISRAGRLMSIA